MKAKAKPPSRGARELLQFMESCDRVIRELDRCALFESPPSVPTMNRWINQLELVTDALGSALILKPTKLASKGKRAICQPIVESSSTLH